MVIQNDLTLIGNVFYKNMVNDCPKIDKICVEIDVGCFWENRLVLVLILRRVMKTN